jgi:hypothetical protein
MCPRGTLSLPDFGVPRGAYKTGTNLSLNWTIDQ